MNTKKGIVIILAVAIIGALGVYSKSSSSPHLVTPKNNLQASSTSQPASSSAAATGYKNGTFTGASEATPYGNVQIAVVISGGKITDVNFLQMPYDLGHSQMVTSYSEPLLKQITLQRQSSNIDFVSGATSTSYGYQLSLQSALDQAAQGGSSQNSSNTNSSSGTNPSTNPYQSSPYGGGGGELFDN